MDVIPISSAPDGSGTAIASCSSCGAPLAPDQRYCLACGQPCSPVRLAFLDVLTAEPGTTTAPILGAPRAVGYMPPPDPPGLIGTLRRWSGVFGLLGVLLASLLVGLLVGHWLTGGSGSGKQVFEVKGLSGLAAAPAAATSADTGSGGTSTGSSSSSGHHGSSSTSSSGSSSGAPHSHGAASGEGGVEESAAEEATAAKEVQTTKPLPAAHAVSGKLEHTTGRQHAKEVKELGSAPLVSK
jgi:hypothetical protein